MINIYDVIFQLNYVTDSNELYKRALIGSIIRVTVSFRKSKQKLDRISTIMNSFTQRFEQLNIFGSLFTNDSHAQYSAQRNQNDQWLNSTLELEIQGESQDEEKLFNPVLGRASLYARNEKKQGVNYLDSLQKEYDCLSR